MGRKTVLPPLVVTLVVLFIYAVYMYANVIPQLQQLEFSHDPTPPTNVDPHVQKSSSLEVIFTMTSFHVLFFMFILSFLRAILTPAGSVPDDHMWINGSFGISEEDNEKVKYIINDVEVNLKDPALMAFLKRMPVVERKKIMGCLRRCRRCKKYKPDRTHHCAVCDQCVLRMDHHCPWIANCVGFKNYKYFCLVLFYAILCTAFILVTMLERFIAVFQPVIDWSYFLKKDLPIATAYVLCIFLFFALVSFFGFHIYLTFMNMTTIEYREKKNHVDKAINHRFQVAHTKFDNGPYSNFLTVFGPPHLWLIPVAPDPLADGTYLSMNAYLQQSQTDTEDDGSSQREWDSDIDCTSNLAANKV